MKKPENKNFNDFSINNDADSPQTLLFERLANKWFLMLLSDIVNGPERFSSLLKKHQKLSQKMLSQTLKNLEEDGLVTRHVNGNKMPIEVTYKITAFGIDLYEVVKPLFGWSNENVEKVLAYRKKYQKKQMQ
ncbi:winged helix-turn-helix transcriptional regulator [Pluralibacter gergoviae]|uniref:Helix-turn-helix domain-containing protein n=1 Tax=Pluralibacter gergoviae TaxID=61647 RepID=A0AAW8HR96_PLUGE|nr:helix-turn-helix domain-containing protein [Pluralibacter gergoviae]EKV0929086.1 helix-turn-helix transcriptional regulator [Pluralibacter gergoviae]EKV6245501.1 helix-turn-helix transcriptional regulator [Pluralibacter gergoviae]EKW9966195.1 helix-turn-helix transcriptional regulator [Pluralibacter gergoviae]EKZ9516011.1 helix-turn-helix transcriptional regulator [Pluralibacter gergoviae]ELC3018225.1 helix-turn-helix transcriptional regulator [Pluralibacter gergoviae]